jgi:hypothetical protein
MADADHARKSAVEHISKLKTNTKAFTAHLDELGRHAAEHHSKIEKLQTAIDRMKPPPDKKATLGSHAEARKLLEASRLTEASAHYERSRQEASSELGRSGQQRALLNNLTSMLSISVEQHTGGKAGEAFESRRDTRLIHMALKGLHDADAKHEATEKAMKQVPTLSAPVSKDTKIGDLKAHAKTAKDACSGVDDLKASYTAFTSTFDDAAKQALQGISEADSIASA